MSLKTFQRLALADAEVDETTRAISFVFASPNVALDGHRILPGAWQTRGYDGLADFRANPVFLWAHDATKPPVGKVPVVVEQNGFLRGSVQFADYDFATTIYELYRGGFLRGASVSWEPVDWSYATGPDRAPGAIDFKRVRLIEISGVPLPADLSALAVARSLGGDWTIARGFQMPVNIRAVKEPDWKCAASRTLPLDEDSDWDGPAAAKSVFDACGFDTNKPDSGKAKKAFLAYDASAPELKGSYKLPFAKMVDGRMTAVASGLHAAASRLSNTDIPDDVQDDARAVITHYEDKMTKSVERELPKGVVTKRGLYEVSNLSYLLAQLGWIKQSVDSEETAENDTASTAPANLLASIKIVGKALTDMAEEEVGELIASFGSLQLDDGDDDTIVEVIEAGRGLGHPQAALTRSGRRLSKSDSKALESIHDHARRTARLARASADANANADADARDPGRAAAADAAETVCDHAEQTRSLIRSYIDTCKGSGPSPESPEDTGDDAAEERARRARRARAKRLRAALIPKS
ncbi:HK97 family phage prohead protease [Methylovirgula sp. HY1]|uniref:HK97 family phage prohead protease n=1 Tax=Methylovirgula sp. HY1 TaxID=2822761 RepID=UPI001C5AE399|nr:HK97 family phage prohead protease [Methylovirgula sp. HY1]QXX74248.1 hypothetical protein MHY1_01058 [Methylovirgula sp. HY1]